MRNWIVLGAVVAIGLTATLTAAAGNSKANDRHSANPLTLAVFGDAPYGGSNSDTAAFAATPAFVDAVNHDPSVRLVAHVGDIHSGKPALHRRVRPVRRRSLVGVQGSARVHPRRQRVD